MDAGIKAQLEELCSQFGMSVNTAMNIFANAAHQRGSAAVRHLTSSNSVATRQNASKLASALAAPLFRLLHCRSVVITLLYIYILL